MILELLQDIKRAAYSITDLQMIDLDREQLENISEHESLLYPCLLVSMPLVDWDELAHGNQKGQLTFDTKTIIQLPQHSAFYLNSEIEHEHLETLTSENLNALLIEDAIHQQIIKIDSVTRESTKEYPIVVDGSTLWVVEHSYTKQAYYYNTPRYQTKTTPTGVGINVIIDETSL